VEEEEEGKEKAGELTTFLSTSFPFPFPFPKRKREGEDEDKIVRDALGARRAKDAMNIAQ